ncbi:MAG: CCA tRNA nucleotidyltransferase [Planctomycetota bacterium]|nr:CCA tRNA nucleotidyltransferase [Planctomycetota bacterium]
MTSTTAHQGSKPPCLREDALAVLTRLREAGHVAYFAGGCVRDELLGLTPKDYDVATDAPPDRVRKLFTNTQAVGAAFGVILVRHKKSVIEVATFRTDGEYIDGRRPEGVTFTTAEEDAKRRDFTINGMFLDPVGNRVIDYVGGQRDLKYKWLRAIGNPDERFEEDHLRLLRAVRFAARFGLEIKGETAGAIASHAEQLIRISPERIAEELRLMLTPTTRGAAWYELRRLALMPVIFRHLPGGSKKPQIDLRIFPLLSPGEGISFGLAIAALALCYRASYAQEDIRALLERNEVRRTVQGLRTGLKISNEEGDLVAGTTELAPLLSEPPPTVAIMKRFLSQSYAWDARRLLRAIAAAIVEFAPRVQWLEQQFESFRGNVASPPLVTGDDLTDAGLKPGPRFKVALDQTYDAQLEGRVTTRKDAIEMAIAIAKGEPA